MRGRRSEGEKGVRERKECMSCDKIRIFSGLLQPTDT